MSRQFTSKIYKISNEDFEEIVKSSKTYSEMLRRCGLEHKGGNINTVKRRIALFKLDDSHISKGLNSTKGRIFTQCRITLDKAKKEIFIKNSKAARQFVKKLILRFNLVPYKCECGNEGVWREKKLSLQLEHRNGIPNDHRPENLQFLCPNCHSQTDTYAGKSTRKNPKPSQLNPLWRRNPRLNQRKVERPTKEILQLLINENPFTKIGKTFDVSESAVRKWCKSYGIQRNNFAYLPSGEKVTEAFY